MSDQFESDSHPPGRLSPENIGRAKTPDEFLRVI